MILNFKIFVVTISLFILTGCKNKNSHIYINFSDEQQCVTVITNDSLRYLIDGRHQELPDTNYVVLNVNKIDELGDGIWISWEDKNYNWEIVVNDSKVIESKLDTTRFRFNSKLPVDDRGIPSEIKFRSNQSVIFDYYLMRLSPDGVGTVEVE